MPKFVILLNYTEQGIRNIKDGPQSACARQSKAPRLPAPRWKRGT